MLVSEDSRQTSHLCKICLNILMFSFQQTKLFIILGIVLLICMLGLAAASNQIKKQKSQVDTTPRPINPQITITAPTPTPASFRF